MTLHPCVRCTANQADVARLARQCNRRQAASLSIKKQLEEIEVAKENIKTCEETGHLSMERGRDASRARHARGREARA